MHCLCRQYRESLLGKCNNVQQNTNQVAQVDPNQQQQQQPQQQAVVDVFAQPFNGAATTSTQALAHTHGRYSLLQVIFFFKP